MRKKSRTEIQHLISARDVRNRPGKPHYPSLSHQLYEYLHLAAALGAPPDPLPPRLEVTEAEVASAKASLIPEIHSRWPQLAGSEALEILALNPGAAYGPAKRWPADRFAAVTRRICSERPKTVWIALGGTDDKACCEGIARSSESRVLNLAGSTSLRQLMALLRLSRVLLTNDSGPMHVAAALRTPVVVPFGSTSHQLTGPGLPGDQRNRILTSNAPCSPCFLPECPVDFRCMNGISVTEVTDALLQVLA
jgi:heptosyltransferase-2